MARHKLMFGTSLSAALGSLLVSLQLPKVLNTAVDAALVTRHSSLGHYVWLAGGLALGTAVLGLLARLLLMKVAFALEFDLRNLVYEHLSAMPAAFFDRHQSGQLISRANSDIRAVQMYLAYGPFIIVQCVGAALAFVFMLTIDVPLAFASMATLPLVAGVAMRMQRSLLPVSWLIQSRLADVATVVDESISGVRVVKSFAAEEREVRTLTRAASGLRWAYIKDADLRARYAPFVQNLSQLSMVTLLLLGGHEVLSGHLQVGAMLAFSSYMYMLQAPFQMLGALVMLGQRAAASAARVYELLDEEPTVFDRPGAAPLEVTGGEVTFMDVAFGYDAERAVLDGFDLTLRRGEVVALVGRTGSGKSTVGRLLTRSYDVDRGAVRIDGTDIRDVTQASLRAAVGVVMEEPFLFSASIRDNIAYGRPDATLAEVQEAARLACAEEFVLGLPEGYDTVVGERGYSLSGGQRQRIALARALLVDAPILVLDDATSSLDVEVEAAVHEGLAATMTGRTVLVVAHRLSTIATADRVVVLDEGRVVAEGTHQELLATSAVYNEVLTHVHAHEPPESAGDEVDEVDEAEPEWPLDRLQRGLGT